MTKPLPLIFALLLTLSLPAYAGLEIITLQHRPAAELVSTLQPFIDKDGAIRANGFQLIIRTSDANLAEIKRIVEKLDRAPRLLLITVRQPLASEESASGGDISGRLSNQGDSHATVRIYSTESRDKAATDQQLQVLEGHAATIRIGQEIPVGKVQQQSTPWGTQTQAGVEYKEVSSGFTVIPRLNGDQVILDIAPEASSPSRQGGGVINVQRAQSTLMGKLGQWIEMGGIVNNSQQSGQGITYSTRSRDQISRRILIKVDELKP